MAGLLDKIKQEATKAGASKGKIFYVRENEKRRVRFLNEINDGLEIVFHSNFEKKIGLPCQSLFGRVCPYCEVDDVKTRSQFAWTVWDYDAKETKLFIFAVNSCSPVTAIANIAEQYGTLCDRDYVISVTGKSTAKTYSVLPMDIAKFRNDKAKPLSQATILKILDKAFPPNDSDGLDVEADEIANSKYENMKAIDLYKLCKQREIEVEPKKPAAFYINHLKVWDTAQEDWGDDKAQEANSDDDEEKWDDDDSDLPF